MTKIEKIKDQLDLALEELRGLNVDTEETDLLYDYIFEANRLTNELIKEE